MDQLVVGVLLAVAMLVVGAYWLAQGGHQGRLIDIDRAEPLSAEFRVDLNEAQWPEFAQLPGIGETLARRIVDSRNTEGPFTSIEDLQRVRGIGPRTVQNMKHYLHPMPVGGTVVER